MTKILFVVAIVVVGGWMVFFNGLNKSQTPDFMSQLTSLPDRSFVPVKLGDTTMKVEVVNKPASIAKGLSERDEIGSDGMLFVLQYPDIHGFWMMDMKFNLDIIWISDQQVIGFELNAPKPVEGVKDLPIYQPGQPVELVLETEAGFVNKHQIQVGDQLSLISQF